jgi:hypothetical protein
MATRNGEQPTAAVAWIPCRRSAEPTAAVEAVSPESTVLAGQALISAGFAPREAAKSKAGTNVSMLTLWVSLVLRLASGLVRRP